MTISWLCCLEIQSKPASVHLLCTSETGCCRAAGPARNHSQVYLKYTPQLSPTEWGCQKELLGVKTFPLSLHFCLLLSFLPQLPSELSSHFKILHKMVTFCRFSSIHIQRKEPLGYAITLLNFLMPLQTELL